MPRIGELGNKDHMNVSLGKAGRSRWLGRRPKVRGTAMNPVDHPHGGGEGKDEGRATSRDALGQPTKGYKTRKKPQHDQPLHREEKEIGGPGVSRSIKKGPFIAKSLYKQVTDMNKSGEKRMVKTYSRTSTIIPRWSATRSPCTTARHGCPCT